MKPESSFTKDYEHSVSDLRDVLDRLTTIAYEAGRADENADIIGYLQDQADKFEAMRPEPHKDVATTMDVRIHTIRKIAEHLKLGKAE